MPPETLLGLLQVALKWLAAPSAQQIEHLKDIGVWPGVDELALAFDDVAPLLPEAVERGEVSNEVESAVRCVDEKLDKMSGQQNAHLWTPDALADSYQWETVRRLASEALRKLETQ